MPVIEQDDVCGMSEAITDFHYEANVFAVGLMTEYVISLHNSSIDLICFYEVMESKEQDERRKAKEDIKAAQVAVKS